MHAQDSFVVTQRGRIHFLEAGSGPPLILAHSNGGSAHEYEFVMDALAMKYRVIAWDMPGHDDSDAIVALMDSLGIAKAQMTAALPKAPRIVCEDCGHFPMIDDPAAFCAAIDKGFELAAKG